MPPSMELRSSSLHTPRIPVGLQSVFLASNRGNVVDQPPPDKSASKTFSRIKKFGRRLGLDSVSWHSRRDLRKQQKGVAKKHQSKGVTKKVDEIITPQLTLRDAQIKIKSSLSLRLRIKLRTLYFLPAFCSSQVSSTCLSPQAHLDSILRKRGYSTRRCKTLQSAYYNRPTPLQQASHHVHLVELIRNAEYCELESILSSGISPNPCNEWGESLIHMLSRRGDYKMLAVFIKHGCSLQVADDFGRTPLHDACWASDPSFETVEMIIKQDPRLLHMTDCRDSPPLAYIQSQHWPLWNRFLDAIEDKYWPRRDLVRDGKEGPPLLTQQKEQSRPLPDPQNALSLELARMVASGKLAADEAVLLRDHDDNEDDDDDDLDVEDFYDDDSDESSSGKEFGESIASIATFCEDEMQSILLNISTHSHTPIRWSQETK